MADIAKSSHHGSNEFLDAFLASIFPIATIISSGDNELHVHPRPDTLGAIGKNSRGERPLIFSTELARSAREKISLSDKDIQKLQDINDQISDKANAARKADLEKKKEAILAPIERNIAVYGMITVRSDGNKFLIAMKKESKGAGFISYKYILDAAGEWIPDDVK
jgi:hypothetical protein